MKLQEWMDAKSLGDQCLADELGVDRTTVSRIRRGKQFPSPSLIERIARLTAGAVSPNSFYNLAAE